MKKILTSKVFVSFGYGFLLSLIILAWSCAKPVIAEESTPNQKTFKKGLPGNLQYASNMRYPRSTITYKTYNCPKKKVKDVEQAFKIISDLTVLSFNEVDKKEDVTISCLSDIYADKQEGNDGTVHLGVGGLQFHDGEKFDVIVHGKVELKRTFDCEYPVVELHEILHALGYDHSSNEEYIMYPIASCGEVLNNELIDDINNLYATPSLPDLSIESASLKRGRNDKTILTFEIKNLGLVKSKDVVLTVYDVGKRKMLDEYKIEGIDIDENRGGRVVFPFRVSVLSLEIVANFDELEKENNIVKLIRN